MIQQFGLGLTWRMIIERYFIQCFFLGQFRLILFHRYTFVAFVRVSETCENIQVIYFDRHRDLIQCRYMWNFIVENLLEDVIINLVNSYRLKKKSSKETVCYNMDTRRVKFFQVLENLYVIVMFFFRIPSLIANELAYQAV